MGDAKSLRVVAEHIICHRDFFFFFFFVVAVINIGNIKLLMLSAFVFGQAHKVS